MLLRDRLRSLSGACLCTLAVACTPVGEDLTDTVDPDAGLEETAEFGEPPAEDALEPIYGDEVDIEVALEHRDGDPLCHPSAPPTEAVEIPDPSQPPDAGLLAVKVGDRVLALPLQHTSFDTVVVGTVAETEVVQTFANPFDEAIEAVYMFPLHERSAVDDYRLTIGDRTIRGQIMTRDDARETYEQAKDEGKTAGLLEQERPNIFTQNVANIPPGEAIQVSLHVVQPLEQDDGKYALVLPTVVGPRFIPQDAAGKPTVADADRVTAPILPEGMVSCADIDVSVALEPGMRPVGLRSTFHAIDIDRQGDVAFVTMDEGTEGAPVVANRDFELSWSLGAKAPQAAIVAQPDADGSGGYFTLTIQPPKQVADADAVARELVFVVDNSGSMGGQPMDTAKALMRKALADMRPDDTFTVLRFSESASGLSDDLLPATADNIQTGLDYVDAMAGMGGTHMLAGIEAALDLPHDDDRLRVVMFLTDGYIGNEEDIFALIERDIGDARLFSLGVGTSPNRYLLDGMANVGRGAVAYAGVDDDIAPTVDRFYERVATPVLTDVELDWQGLAVAEVLPGRIPDLFAGQPVTVFGRYSGDPDGDIVLRAKARGKTVDLPVRFAVANAPDVEGVSSMWARNKIDELLAYPHRSNAYTPLSDGEKQAVIDVALQHRIMTEFTSFVAVDERVVTTPGGETKTIHQPLEIPQGTTHQGFGGEAYGVGGLGLVGTGRGGGGVGYGSGSGAGFGGKGKRVPKVRSAKAKVTGSLDKDIIRRIVRAHINQVRACYEKQLNADPNLQGKVAIKFSIGTDGKVISATVDSNDSGNAELGSCVAKAVRRWKFPKTGATIEVVYPFNFSPG